MDFPPTTGLEGVLSQIGTVVGQFLVALAVAMIVLPPVIAVLWVVWTRLILEALVVHFQGRGQHQAHAAGGSDAAHQLGQPSAEVGSED